VKAKGEKWAVIGGGMMGMTIALRLAQAGKRVVLYEAASVLGGLASPWRLGDITWDRHYHVTLLSDSNTRKILSELGLENGMQWVETKTGFMADGKLVSMSNAFEYLGIPGLSLIDKARIAATIVYGSRVTNWRKLEQMRVEDWLVSLSGRSGFDRLWRPLLQAKLGDAWPESSAAFIWATIQRLYAARRTGLKKEMFGYVPGGYAKIVEAFGSLLERHGAEVHVGEPVARVSEANGGLRLESKTGAERFRRVVFTTTPRTVSRLCPDLTLEEKESLEGVPYQGVVCASLLLEKSVTGYYLTYLTDDWVPFTAIIEMSSFVDPSEFGGKTLVYLPRYAAGNDAIFGESDDSIRERFIGALSRIRSDFANNTLHAFRISRVREVFPLPRLGYSRKLPATNTSIPGVLAVSSAHIVNGTLNVNDTLRVAERAARSILFNDGRHIFLE
jgi:protoporphyrinogen oxidase